MFHNFIPVARRGQRVSWQCGCGRRRWRSFTTISLAREAWEMHAVRRSAHDAEMEQDFAADLERLETHMFMLDMSRLRAAQGDETAKAYVERYGG